MNKSTKYLVLTVIDGKIHYLGLKSSIEEPQKLYAVCRSLLAMRFGQEVTEFQLEPWPL